MSIDIPIVAHLNEEQEAIDSEAITLNPPDPYRFPVISYSPKKGNPTNIYRYSHSEVPSACEPLFNTSRKILRKNIEQAFGTDSGNISYELLMCGTFPETAKPALVVKCAMNVIEKVQKVLTQESLLKRCHLRPHGAAARFVRRIKRSMGALTDQDELTLGLEIYGCGSATRPPVRTELRGRIPDVFDTKAIRYDSRQHFSPLCGAKVNCIGGNTSATLSGVIQIGTEFYGLTTSHPFRDDCLSKPQGADKHRIGHLKGWFVPVEVALQDHGQIFQTKVWIPSIVSFNSTIPNLDWALVLLDEAMLRDCDIEINPSASERSSISTHALKHPGWEPEVLALTFGAEPKNGTLLQGTVYYTNCLSAEVAVWTVALDEDCPVEKGDSGSLVIEADVGIAYGYVVARDTFGRAEIIPLHSALDQISSLTGIDHVEFMDKASLAYRQDLIPNSAEVLSETRPIPSALSRAVSNIIEGDRIQKTNGDCTTEIDRNISAKAIGEPVTELMTYPASTHRENRSRHDFEIAIAGALLVTVSLILEESYHFEQNDDLYHFFFRWISTYNVGIACASSVLSRGALFRTGNKMMKGFPSTQFAFILEIPSGPFWQILNGRSIVSIPGFWFPKSPDYDLAGQPTLKALTAYVVSFQRQAYEDDQLRQSYSTTVWRSKRPRLLASETWIDAASIDLAARDGISTQNYDFKYYYDLYSIFMEDLLSNFSRSSNYRTETPVLEGFRNSDTDNFHFGHRKHFLLSQDTVPKHRSDRQDVSGELGPLSILNEIVDLADDYKENQRHTDTVITKEPFESSYNSFPGFVRWPDIPAERQRKKSRCISKPIETLKHSYDVVVVGRYGGAAAAAAKTQMAREKDSLRLEWNWHIPFSSTNRSKVDIRTSSLKTSGSLDSCWFLTGLSGVQRQLTDTDPFCWVPMEHRAPASSDYTRRKQQIQASKREVYYCSQCERVFTRKEHLERHSRSRCFMANSACTQFPREEKCKCVVDSLPSHDVYLPLLPGVQQRLKELQLSTRGWLTETVRECLMGSSGDWGEYNLILDLWNGHRGLYFPQIHLQRHRSNRSIVSQDLRVIVALYGGIPMLLHGGRWAQSGLCLQIWLCCQCGDDRGDESRHRPQIEQH